MSSYGNGGPYHYTQKKASKLAKRLPAADILICHCPPLGVNDDPDDPAHVGFEGLRDWVDRHQPRHILHGHTHPIAGLAATRYGDARVHWVSGRARASARLSVSPTRSATRGRAARAGRPSGELVERGTSSAAGVPSSRRRASASPTARLADQQRADRVDDEAKPSSRIRSSPSAGVLPPSTQLNTSGVSGNAAATAATSSSLSGASTNSMSAPASR